MNEDEVMQAQPVMQTQPMMQPQPVPQPVPQPQPMMQQQIQYVPAIQGVQFYFSIGQSMNGIQLYSYDSNLGQWRIAQPKEMENILCSLGVPINVINALKQFKVY